MGGLRVHLSSIGDAERHLASILNGVFIAVRAYLDSSGKPHERRLTLAAFGAKDELWQQLEDDWRKVLNDHPLKPQYIHMKELCHLKGEFAETKGWTQESAFGLLNQVLMFLQLFKKQEFQMFYCTIDLAAHRKLLLEGYKMPKAVDICNEYCAEVVVKSHIQKAWRADPNAQHAEEMVFVFDNNEPFFHPFYKKWTAKAAEFKARGGFNMWNVITDVYTTTRMKDLPGLQAADVLAWCVNREHTAKEGQPGKMHAHILRQIVSQYYIAFDEAKLRQMYGVVKLR